MTLRDVYDFLLEEYGPQGWWPVSSYPGSSVEKTGSHKGYHPLDYDIPLNEKEMLEICIGAILTQNTSWLQAEKALYNLIGKDLIDSDKIIDIELDELAELIMPAGYYNQKAKKLKILAGFLKKLDGKTPAREELLGIWGIGKETADSILLYAYKIPTFVVDAYTKRILLNLGLVEKTASYEDMKELFEKNLELDYRIFQEYHALLVEHAKQNYARGMDFNECPLKELV